MENALKRKGNLVACVLILIVVCLGIVLAGDVVVKEGDLEATVLSAERVEASLGFYQANNDLTTGMHLGLKNQIRFYAGDVKMLWFQHTMSNKTIFNEEGVDVDFKVKSMDHADMFFIDAANNRIGVGITPSYPLHVGISEPNISVYGQGWAKFAGYATHTPSDKGYTGNYLDLIKPPDEMLDADGKLKRENLINEAVTDPIIDYSRPVINPDTNEVEYPYMTTEDGMMVDTMAFNNRLLISELKQEIQMLKDELCKKDPSYSWCE